MFGPASQRLPEVQGCGEARVRGARGPCCFWGCGRVSGFSGVLACVRVGAGVLSG